MTDERLAIHLPVTAADVAALQAEADSDAAGLVGVTCGDAATYEVLDTVLTDVVRRKDALTAMRKTATGPLYGVIKTVEGWFRPVLGSLETSEKHLKAAMGAYRVAQIEAATAAATAATAALGAGDVDTAMAIVAATVTPTGRASVRYAWKAVIVDVSIVPREYMVPDMARIERAHPDNIPGVRWDKVATIGAKR